MTAPVRALGGFALWAVFAASCMAADPRTIEPGLWAYSANTFIGAKTGEQCVQPEHIDEFLTGPHNRHYRCVYPTRSIGDGRISFAGDCLDKGDRHRYHLVVHGSYRPREFELSGTVTGSLFGVSVTAPMSIHAHRLAATCPEPHQN